MQVHPFISIHQLLQVRYVKEQDINVMTLIMISLAILTGDRLI